MAHAATFRGRGRWALALIAGLALPLAFAPFQQFWIAPVSYALLLWCWKDTRPGDAFRLGLVFGIGSFGAGTYWTYIAVAEFGEAPVALAVALSLGLMTTLALFVAAAGYAAARWFKTSGAVAWLATLPALWVLTEWLRGWMFSGFGWLAAGYSQTDSYLMGYAPVLGLHGMSFAVVASAGALTALAFGSRAARLAAATVLVVVWGLAFALHGRDWTQPKPRDLSVALVQGAVPQTIKWDPDQLAASLQLYKRLTERNAGTNLIVWPEAAIATLYEFVPDYLADLRAWSEAHRSSVMFGILRRTPGDTQTFQNVLVALTTPEQLYVKRHLVPFGEYFPVPAFVRSWMRLMSLPYTDATPGDDTQPPVEVAGELVGVTICYEDVFGAEQLHYLPEATLLVNVSNDAWFGDSIAPHQHLQIARVRAAEAGRYLLRATNTGITAIIDQHGGIVSRGPQFEPVVLNAVVRGYTGATPYARWGNYPVIVAALLVLLVQLPITKFTIRPRT